MSLHLASSQLALVWWIAVQGSSGGGASPQSAPPAPPTDPPSKVAAQLPAPATREALERQVQAYLVAPDADHAARALDAIVHGGFDPKLLVALAETVAHGQQTLATEPLLRALLDLGSDRDARGWAAYHLGHLLISYADDLAFLAGDDLTSAVRAEFIQRRGAPLLEALATRGGEALARDGLALLHRVSDDFYFVDHRTFGYLGALADAELFELEHLQIGMVAPEIEGVDEDGVPFKLSDYRGKVVALDFWGFWCPICVRHLPGERLLVERLRDRSFALVGINSDERDRLQIGARYDRLSWRSFFDGGDAYGPIAKRWNVTIWPTMYVLDENGVIHAKTEELDQVEAKVDELLARVEGKQSVASDASNAPAPPRKRSMRP